MRVDHSILNHRKHLERQGKSGPWIVLFDIDSTLMDTAPRNAAIVDAAYTEVPGLRAWRNLVTLDHKDWGILQALKRAGITDQDLFRRMQTFWEKCFFSDEWLVHDRPYPGVATFLNSLKAQGFVLAYLTGRHTSGMEKGTRKSFLDNGVPAGPEEVFFFKPTFEMGDREFKASVLKSVADLGTLVAAVDNEPANVNLFRAGFPDGRAIWIDTLTSPEPEILAEGIDRVGPEFFLNAID